MEFGFALESSVAIMESTCSPLHPTSFTPSAGSDMLTLIVVPSMNPDAEDITELVATAAGQITEGPAVVRSRQEIADRLHLVGKDLDVRAPGRVPTIDEVWYFANSGVNQHLR